MVLYELPTEIFGIANTMIADECWIDLFSLRVALTKLVSNHSTFSRIRIFKTGHSNYVWTNEKWFEYTECLVSGRH